MTLSLIDLRLDVLTGRGPLSYQTTFGPGLNVLSAPNSFGKSTLLQSIIFALGLEGMITRSGAVPLGPIMTTVADYPDGQRSPVIESWITMTMRNGAGRYLRTRRFAKSANVDARLVQMWAADSLDALDESRRSDAFVRMPGAAVRPLGFHSILAEFIGWKLPLVPMFQGPERPLYLEALFPLFFVEQKNGWGGVTPRMPTYLGIRDMLRRAVEYVLGLSTLDRVRAANALRDEITACRNEWSVLVSALQSVANSEGVRLTIYEPHPVSAQQLKTAHAEVLDGEVWRPLSVAAAEWRERLATLRDDAIMTSGDRTDRSRVELVAAERAVSSLGAQLRASSEQRALVEADLGALASRLAAVMADRQRLLDLQRLKTLGSDVGVATLSDDLCPTCLQTLDDRHAVTGEAASLEQTLVLGDAERLTLVDMQGAATRRAASLDSLIQALQQELSNARQRVRLLRDDLTSRTSAPSVVEVRTQLELKERLSKADRVNGALASAEARFTDLAERYDDARSRLAVLDAASTSPEDAALLAAFNANFQSQLRTYQLSSLPPEQVAIDDDTLVPTDDGVELRFDISVGMSASDTIRTKWAYYVALMQAAKSPQSHHARLLVFDEPRQQETAKVSLAALIRELGTTAESGNQVIYATSEDTDEIDSYLSGIAHHRLAVSGQHLLQP